MRKFLFILILISISNFLFAQKEGNIWMFGDSAGLNFNNNPPTLYESVSYSNEACSSICDKNGDLVLYSGNRFHGLNNTIVVWNKNNNIIHNGDSLKGWFSITQGIILLPNPSITNKYVLLHLDSEDHELYCSTIDMNCDGNNGCVIKKNKPLLPGISLSEKMNAVRHANGRDWWILLHSQTGNSFYKFLLTFDTILLNDVQQIGSLYVNDLNGTDAIGQMMFSRDGTKLASVFRKADIFDFDRCTGVLSNWFYINNLPFRNYGVSFSNSNRFVYISYENNYPDMAQDLFQYDLNSLDILNSKRTIYHTVGNNDGNPDSIGIWQHNYGPDGKIYVSVAFGGYAFDGFPNCLDHNHYISVINNPDSEGVNCNFIRKGIYLSYRGVSLGLPNIPNYALGKIDGSSCDTIRPPVIAEIPPLVYIPNIFSPNNDGFNDVFYVRGKEIESLHFLIYNRWGNLVFESNELSQGWDGTQNGKMCEAGVYAFVAEVRFKDGREENRKGTVTLVR
jgi:gliding motility-associated-like protein